MNHDDLKQLLIEKIFKRIIDFQKINILLANSLNNQKMINCNLGGIDSPGPYFNLLFTTECEKFTHFRFTFHGNILPEIAFESNNIKAVERRMFDCLQLNQLTKVLKAVNNQIKEKENELLEIKNLLGFNDNTNLYDLESRTVIIEKYKNDHL